MRERLLNVAVVVMAGAALVTTGLVVRRQFARESHTVVTDGTLIEGWQRYLDDREPVGAHAAALTIIEYSDFQCPACRAYADTLDRVRELYPNDVAIAHRHFPIDRYPHSYEAAMTAECAREQGRYQQVRDLLFARQDSIGTIPWVAFATGAGVPDQTGFARCMKTKAHAARIESDRRDGRAIGMEMTPTSLINGVKVSGIISVAELAKRIEAAKEQRVN
ncbi:DsbA family protein [Longimicrobium sp.]|jgi:protein-disulfide isomerase|uniref:DsbA family protein n=1 Tax=Longimicrobium sp. TaxID=2029185 RepID=UPI002EDB3B49